ncbi:MAG TPA: DUF433 domain-containing protein [Nordella sp.]|nr:DUF433 domain-containing protein [Nordella sp.]
MSRLYSPAEAAALSGIGVKAVHNAIDKRIVDTVAGPRPPGRRALTQDSLLRLKLWYGIGSTLTAGRRQRLFDEIKAAPNAKMVKADDLLIIDVAEARKQLKARMSDLDEAEAAIGSVKGVMGGEPVFKGTRIPARLVAAMIEQGAEERDILDGYPSLKPRMIELAKIWSVAHPARGRPRLMSDYGFKVTSTKRITLKGLDPRASMRPRARRSA